MASGKEDNVNKANQATKNAVNASKPKNYSDPYGKFENGVYTPNLNSDQINTRDNTLGKIDSIVAGMPTELSANDLFNNDFYEPLNNMYKSAIDSQYQTDKRELNNQLNARNQIGGSYDALKNYYLNKDYGSRYQNAQSQARLGAADAWTQAFQNSIAGLGALRGDAMNAQNMAYQPMQMYLGYQGAVSPLQQTAANAYMNQASQYWNQAQNSGFLNTANNVMNTIQNYYKTAWSPISAGTNALAPLMGSSGNASQIATRMAGA